MGIEPVKKELGAQIEMDTQLGRRARESGRLPQHNAAFALRTGQTESPERCRAQAHRKLSAPYYRLVHDEISALVNRVRPWCCR